MKITPAILTESFLTLQHQVDVVKYSPLIEAIHIDVIDGQFADDTTVTPLDLTVAEFEPAKVDFHFMVDEPMDFVYECEALKEYLPIRRMIGQIERMSFQQDFISAVKSNGWEAILAINLFTPIEEIQQTAWSQIDGIMLMGVEAGRQGEKQHPYLLRKLQEVYQMFGTNRHFPLIVDGGVKLDNVQNLLHHGVNEVVIGSQVWHSNDPLLTIEEFAKLSISH